MKKGLAVPLILISLAVILFYYSGTMNRKFLAFSNKRAPVQATTEETSLVQPNGHSFHETVQMGSAHGSTTPSSWQTTQATLETASTVTGSTGVSTGSASPAALTDGILKVPQDSTQTTATVNTDSPASHESFTTTARTVWPMAPMTTTIQTDASDVSLLPGSATITPGITTAAQKTTTTNIDGSSTNSIDWSSIPTDQMTIADQSKANHTTLRTAPIMTPPGSQTSLTTAWNTAPAQDTITPSILRMTTQSITPTYTSTPMTTVGPDLVTKASTPQTRTYLLYNGSRACLKADMGVQLAIQDTILYTSARYFNLEPNAVRASGNCGPQRTNLLLAFPGGFVNLTFAKAEHSYHIETVEACLVATHFIPKVYRAMKSGLMMFETKLGHSFKCMSEQSVELSANFHLRTVDVQLQAFDFDGEHYGNVDECLSDKERRAIPKAVGLSIAGLFAVLLTACLLARKSPSRGYERI